MHTCCRCVKPVPVFGSEPGVGVKDQKWISRVVEEGGK